MKSIRLSLMLYFLGLLGLGLGAVSLLVYHTTQQTLMEKKSAMGQLLESHFQESSTEERDRLDQSLLTQATAIARIVDIPGKPTPNELVLANVVLNGAMPNGLLVAFPWLPQKSSGGPGWDRLPGPLAWEYFRELYSNPMYTGKKFNDRVIDQQGDTLGVEFCQINSAWGSEYRSSNLGTSGRLPFDNKTLLAADRTLGWEYGDTKLGDVKVRRVTLIAPYPRFFRNSVFSTFSRGRGQDDKSQPRFDPTLRPAIAIQCAADTARMEATLADLEATSHAEMARLESDTETQLASLRNTLLAISLATFLATAIGGLALVRVGLSPLGRLSEAVRQVSEKDFDLHVGKERLPLELRPIAGRLAETLGQLKEAFQREKQAAADISHELRTPLAALLTTIDVSLRKPRSAEDYRETLVECRNNGQQMSRMVERLLTLARLDAGVDPLRPCCVDIADLAEQCALMVRPLAEAQSISLTVNLPGPTQVDADPDKVREVLNNLLHNAVQYNRPQGSIELTVVRHNGTVQMRVRDTGIGIAPEARGRIFERFYRADPSRQTDGLNSGLGLAIVKGYVDLMGGTIAVDSTPGEGSTFRVDLPAHKV
jgi:heavy metal sensor kinase